MNFPRNFAIETFFSSWALVGTLDITAASINYLISTGKNPINILVYISSGILGTRAFEIGSPSMAILGIVLHYFIAGMWTLTFLILYPRLEIMRRNFLLTGVVYGIVIWTIMSQIVVRLSHTPKGPFNLTAAIIGAAILCIAIGIPLALIAKMKFKKSSH